MKNISVALLAIIALILTACATPAGAATQANPTQAVNGASGGNQNNSNTPLSPASQLALGTLNLKTTSYQITKDEAATLLPLWEGLRSLSQSTSFSQVEYDALVKQIQNSMTSDQVQAITDMKLTQADMGKIFQSLGLGFGGQNPQGTPFVRTPGARTGGNSGSNGGTNGRGGAGGGDFGGRGFGGGGFGGGGFGGGFGGAGQGRVNATPATQATIVARQAQRANQANPFLASAVINFLQQVSGVATPTPAPTTAN
jgi:hypothetical protein